MLAPWGAEVLGSSEAEGALGESVGEVVVVVGKREEAGP